MKDFSLNRCLSKYRNIVLQMLAQTENLAKLQRTGDFSPRTTCVANSEGRLNPCERHGTACTCVNIHVHAHTDRHKRSSDLFAALEAILVTVKPLDYTSGLGWFEFSRDDHSCQHECVPRVSWGSLWHSEYSMIEKLKATSLLPFYE